MGLVQPDEFEELFSLKSSNLDLSVWTVKEKKLKKFKRNFDYLVLISDRDAMRKLN